MGGEHNDDLARLQTLVMNPSGGLLDWMSEGWPAGQTICRRELEVNEGVALAIEISKGSDGFFGQAIGPLGVQYSSCSGDLEKVTQKIEQDILRLFPVLRTILYPRPALERILRDEDLV